MKGSMFDEEKSDILKDMYGDDISLMDEAQMYSLSGSGAAKSRRTPQRPAPRNTSTARTFTKPAVSPSARQAAARQNNWQTTRGGTVQKPAKSGNGWLVTGVIVFVFTIVLAPAIAFSGLQSMLRPDGYEEKLAEMMGKNQPARAVEFIRENQLGDYDKRDASYAHLVTQARWDNTVLETIDQWQLFVSVVAGQSDADLSYMAWDLASNMETLCMPDDDVTASVAEEDVERGRDAVRGMLLMLGDDGTVFEALCSDDYDRRSEAVDVIEAALDDLAMQAEETAQEDNSFEDEGEEPIAPLNEEV